MDPVDLASRAGRIRLPAIEIARRSGLDKDTVHKTLNAKNDARRSTLQAVEAVIVAEELALRDDLLRQHPVAAAPAAEPAREAA